MPERIQRKRTAGWRMPEGAIYVGRPSQWGNPYVAGPGRPRMPWLPEGTVLTVEQTVACYADMVRGGGPNINGDKWLTSRVGVIRCLSRYPCCMSRSGRSWKTPVCTTSSEWV
ncbi:Uncharacterised protein [Mycobacteroides abscessus subsp. massiliense]|nr:DUF4326 domain-containing protein [Mycobacteroides abscessus]SKE25070.1 Uncharacterised protein [Mycobacteroides abscessus subsp. massiliense]